MSWIKGLLKNEELKQKHIILYNGGDLKDIFRFFLRYLFVSFYHNIRCSLTSDPFHVSRVWLCVLSFCRTLCLRWRTVWGRWSKPSSPSWWMFCIGQSCSSLRTLMLAGSVKAEGLYQSRFKSATFQYTSFQNYEVILPYFNFRPTKHVSIDTTFMSTITYNTCIHYNI